MVDKTISIALTTYNGSLYIGEQLQSIVNQEFIPMEVIICDDASTDNTVEIINQYKNKLNIKLFINENRIGVVANFKQAINKCTGDWVACCDQDDIWLPNKLILSYNAMLEIDGTLPALVYTDLVVVDSNLNVIHSSFKEMRNIKINKENFFSTLFGGSVTGCTMLLNKAMIRELTFMPTNKIIMHDFWVACIAYSWGKFLYINQSTILYRQHSTNVTINNKVSITSRIFTLLKFFQLKFKNFLIPEIEQAKLFQNLYYNKLDNYDKLSINRFISLIKYPPIIRKIIAFFVKNY